MTGKRVQSQKADKPKSKKEARQPTQTQQLLPQKSQGNASQEDCHYTGLSIERKEYETSRGRKHYDHHWQSVVFDPPEPKFDFSGVPDGFESPNYKGKRTYSDKWPSKWKSIR